MKPSENVLASYRRKGSADLSNRMLCDLSTLHPRRGLQHLQCGVDIGNDRRAIVIDHLSERACYVWTHCCRGEDLSGRNDTVHHGGGTEPAVAGDLIPPFPDLDPLGL